MIDGRADAALHDREGHTTKTCAAFSTLEQAAKGPDLCVASASPDRESVKALDGQRLDG